MRTLKTFILFFLFILSAYGAQAGVFEEANAKYQAGDFKSALAQYESLAKSQISSPLYYNLGNTYFRLGNKAKAVLNYERAARLVPRDADVAWNLDIVRSVLTDDAGNPDDTLVFFWLKKISTALTIDEWALFLLAGSLALFIFCLLQFLFPAAKFFLRFFQILAVIYLLSAGIFLSFKWDAVKDPEVVVLDKEVYARFGPSKTETKAFLLHEGAKAKVLDESREWYYVDFGRKSSGWIPKTSCEVI